MKKNITIFTIFIVLTMGLANDLLAQTPKSAYEIIIDRDGFSSFGGKSYTSITIFLNNNTDQTLYYQGADCNNLVFDLKHNSYFHLATDVCNTPVYSKMAIPPHRSQKMEIFLTMDKEPDKDVLLSMTMKLYKWEDSKVASQGKNALSGKLSDTIVLHYNDNHQAYSTRKEFETLDEKEKRILPDKDIYLLNDVDRKLYTLTADEKQITKPRDTVITTFRNNKSEKVKVINVPISVHNNSDDTLKFCTMTCSWYEFWDTDRPGVGLPNWPCDGNSPETVIILPHHKYEKRLAIIYNSTVKRGSQFRIRMSLLKATSDSKRNWFFGQSMYDSTRF